MTARRTTPFRAVVFDLDGTLIDSLPDVVAAANVLLAEHGRRSVTVAEGRSLIGEGARVLVDRAFAATGSPLSAADIESLAARYIEIYRASPAVLTTIFPGAVAVLDRLRDEGVALGICTNKPKASAISVLASLGLDRFFATVTCPEDVTHRKPDGRHLIASLDALGAAPDAAAYIGDSEIDMAAATDAGVASVLVRWGYCRMPHETLAADAIIERFDDLPAALARIAAERVA